MAAEQERKGAMDASYAWDRGHKQAIIFRYTTRALTVVSAIRRHLPAAEPLRLLDFGAADGGTLMEMGRLLGPKTVLEGVEYSSALVALAARLGAAAHVVRGDISSLPAAVKANTYDVVTAMAVLEHLAQPQLAIREAAAVLAPGGLLVATTPQPAWDILATHLRMLEDHHETHIDKAEFVQYVQQAGLELVEYRLFMWAPVGFLPYLGIRVPAGLARRVDELVEKLGVLNLLYVNQMVVARKPHHSS